MIGYIKKSISIFKLNSIEIENVSKDEKCTIFALLTLPVIGVSQTIGNLDFSKIQFYLMASIFGSLLGIFILHFFAKIFGGKANFMEFFRPIALSYFIMIINIVPKIGPILSGVIGIWYVAVNLSVIMIVHKLTLNKAVLVILIPVIIALIISVLMVLGLLNPVINYIGTF